MEMCCCCPLSQAHCGDWKPEEISWGDSLMKGGIWQKRSCPGVGPSRSLFSRAKWQKTVPKAKNERGWSGFKAARHMLCFWCADGQDSLGTTTPGLSEILVASWWQRQIPWGQRFWGEWPQLHVEFASCQGTGSFREWQIWHRSGIQTHSSPPGWPAAQQPLMAKRLLPTCSSLGY